MIDESTKKVLVFVPFKHVIDILADKLVNDGIPTEIIRGTWVPLNAQTYSNDSKPAPRHRCW